MIIRSKAPFRVSFGGGGTDMEPYCIEYGGCVISTAIDRHVHATLKPRKDKKIHVVSIDYESEITFDLGDYNYHEGFELFKGIVNVLEIKDGFDITTYSELPAGSGMGGSSTLSVAVIGAFNHYYDYGLTVHDIAQKAYDIERIELKQKGGYQDQFAAAYGGFNFIEFCSHVKVNPIKLSTRMKNELQYRLLLCYVGGSHFSSDIQEEVLKGYKVEKKSYIDAMQDLKNVAHSMRKILERDQLEDLDEFGKLLHEGWRVKKSLSSKISNNDVENFYLTSRTHGVLGGKLLGAGGGGHLILFSDPEKKYQVVKELERIGGQVVNFHFNPKGLETWRYN
ncbi:MAG: GHMP kinase [Candidatus Lokiarchaeota archaeon]|nr:GHMP kinase [Candidatus Lokiarchaeota archaeon]